MEEFFREKKMIYEGTFAELIDVMIDDEGSSVDVLLNDANKTEILLEGFHEEDCIVR